MKKIIIGKNDLASQCPNVVQEWDYEKNNIYPQQVTKGSDKKVWWICKKCGHSWEATISSRTRGNGCPQCAYEHHTSFPEKAIYYYVSKAFPDALENFKFDFLGKMELDIFIPSILTGIEYDGARWHQRPELDLEKDILCYQHNINVVRIMEDGCKEYESPSFKIKAMHHHSNYDYLTKAIGELLYYLCSSHSIFFDIDVDINRDYSDILQLLITYEKANSFASKYPEFVKYWNYEKNKNITPEMINYASNKKFWWRCSKGDDFQATPTQIVKPKATGTEFCPICANKQIIKGRNDLFTLHPEAKNYWDFEKNEKGLEYKLAEKSNKKVWWKCTKGHSYPAAVYNVVKYNFKCCPFCSGRYPIVGKTDLATTNPELIEEWDYVNNKLKPQDVTKGAHKAIMWKCKTCGHSWKAFVYSRTAGQGCPNCANSVIRGQKVLNLDTGKEYGNARLADQEFGGKSGKNIRRVCTGQRKTAYGYHWKYISK